MGNIKSGNVTEDSQILEEYELNNDHLFVSLIYKENFNELKIVKQNLPQKKPKNAEVVRRIQCLSENLCTNIKGHYLLRHPLIMQIHQFSPTTTPTANGQPVVVATIEKCRPLVSVLKSLHWDEIILGLQQVLEALQFLHDSAKVCHGCVKMEAIFVTIDTTWKLGAFYYATPFSELQPQDWEALHYLTASEEELSDLQGCTFNVTYPWSYDIYCFARMVKKLVGSFSAGSCTFKVELQNFLAVLENSCLHADPAVRLPASQLLRHDIFLHPFVQAHNFLSRFTSRSSTDKARFFHNLLSQLRVMPEDLLSRRLAHLLLSRVVLIDEFAQSTVASLLRPRTVAPGDGGLLSESQFRERVLPLLTNIFAVEERNVRLVLLSHFANYARLFDRRTLKHHIMPKIRLGLFDSHPPLVALSLHALADCVPLLGTEAVLGQPPRGVLFAEAGPKMTGPGPLYVPEVPPTNPLESKPLLKDLAALSAHYKPPVSQSLVIYDDPSSSEHSDPENETQRHQKVKSCPEKKIKGRKLRNQHANSSNYTKNLADTRTREQDESILKESVQPVDRTIPQKFHPDLVPSTSVDPEWNVSLDDWEEAVVDPPVSPVPVSVQNKSPPIAARRSSWEEEEEKIRNIFEEMLAPEMRWSGNDATKEIHSVGSTENNIEFNKQSETEAMRTTEITNSEEVGAAWTEDWDDEDLDLLAESKTGSAELC